jgi:hypothetical protein
MKKFIVFGFNSLEAFDKSLEPTQEERTKIFAQWGEWQKDMGELLVSMGSPLINGVQINEDGLQGGKVSDLSGYMIIQAEDQNHAQKLLKKSPLFGMGHGQKYELFECIM